MNVRSLALTAVIIFLSSCMEVDEYRSALVGNWSGGVEGKRWCMNLNADDSVLMVNEEKKASGDLEITEFNGIWEVSEGGRFKLRVSRRVRGSTAGIMEESVDTNAEPLAESFKATVDEDQVETSKVTAGQMVGITSDVIADELRGLSADAVPERESARLSVRYIVQSISQDKLVYRQHMMGGHYSDEFHVERVDRCII